MDFNPTTKPDSSVSDTQPPAYSPPPWKTGKAKLSSVQKVQTQTQQVQAQTSQVTPQAQTQTESIEANIQTTSEQYQYAGFWKRFFASLIDGIIVGVVSGLLSFLIGLAIAFTLGSANETTKVSASLIAQIPTWFIGPVYFIYFIGKRGQTLGKMAMKIKVIKLENNQPPGYVGAFLRETVGKFISAVVFGIGYLWMIKDEKKQTWHDKIASTIVILEKAS